MIYILIYILGAIFSFKLVFYPLGLNILENGYEGLSIGPEPAEYVMIKVVSGFLAAIWPGMLPVVVAMLITNRLWNIKLESLRAFWNRFL